jgi:hypothetical protein
MNFLNATLRFIFFYAFPALFGLSISLSGFTQQKLGFHDKIIKNKKLIYYTKSDTTFKATGEIDHITIDQYTTAVRTSVTIMNKQDIGGKFDFPMPKLAHQWHYNRKFWFGLGIEYKISVLGEK